jgi:hypothetical protein
MRKILLRIIALALVACAIFINFPNNELGWGLRFVLCVPAVAAFFQEQRTNCVERPTRNDNILDA